MLYAVLDTETNGLLREATKIHVLSYAIYENKELIEKKSLLDYVEMKTFLQREDLIFVCHNAIRFEKKIYEKILDIKSSGTWIDTIAVSYYHYPVKKFKHGLGPWGERLGFGKPLVEDWENQDISVYIERCESDVEINTRLFHFQMDYTMEIYQNFSEVMRLFAYLGFKMECLAEQEEVGITLDIPKAEEARLDLEFSIGDRIEILSRVMPRVVVKEMPKKPYKNDGTLSVSGKNWQKLLSEHNLPSNSINITEAGNPGSSSQLKLWLLSLGWIPETFKTVFIKYPEGAEKNKELIEKLEEEKSVGLIKNYFLKEDNIEKHNAQISLPFGGGLCESISNMVEKYPFLEELKGLYQAKHRYNIFKAYLDCVDEKGKVYATAHGFSNTLRLLHSKPIVNLPGVDSYYGEEIRACLKVPDDSYMMCGSDISGLEDNTKQHYIYFYDPDYVNEMRVPGFDAHMDIAVLSGICSKEDLRLFNIAKELEKTESLHTLTEDEAAQLKSVKKGRKNAKVVNFSATYGAGPPKIRDTLKCTLDFANILHKTYWERNKAVKQTAKDCVVKTVRGQKWLYNPVSGLWLFLKAEKDRFSTLNQSSGVYVFDTWLRKCRIKLRKLGIYVCMQYHDEFLFYFKKEHKDVVKQILRECMSEVNIELKLNVEIRQDTEFGKDYAECH